MLPHCTVFVEGRFNPGVALCGGAGVKLHIGNAPTVVAFFAFHGDAGPCVERRVRARSIDHMVGLKVVGTFWRFNAECGEIFVLFECLHAGLPAQIDMSQFLNALYQIALNVELLDVDERGLFRQAEIALLFEVKVVNLIVACKCAAHTPLNALLGDAIKNAEFVKNL